MQRVLFFAEAVTLAHLARPIVLATGLDPKQFDWAIACSPQYTRFLPGMGERHRPLNSISSSQFLLALARGNPVYDLATLQQYVRDDLALIEQFKPHVVVGDFRLSLSVSARLAGVPYVSVTNAYWSPFYARQAFPLPVLPMTKVLPIWLAERIFNAVRPMAFALHCRPMNDLRREHKLPPLGSDLRRVYTDADLTLYADDEELFPTPGRPQSHRYLGPLLWSPPVPLPPWWSALPENRPLVYLTLGSSGDPGLLLRVVSALSTMDLTVMVATASHPLPEVIPANVLTAVYLPGVEAARRAQLVICNGGSMTTQQALAAGRPVIGICGNMDQFLNMQALEAAGLGLCFRGDRIGERQIQEGVAALLARPTGQLRPGTAVAWPGGVPPGWPLP
jgi:UDP:flavonoid glycosyltransferase YjiC (YdhE family)